MSDVGVRPRASFGTSVFVALGWYATVVAAVITALDGIPEEPRTDCATFAACMSPMQATALALVVGVAFYFVLFLGLAGRASAPLIGWVPGDQPTPQITQCIPRSGGHGCPGG